MNASSEDIKDMLVADTSLGLVFADNLFIGLEPPEPADCVTICDTPGYPPDLSLDGADYQKPSIQVRVRNRQYGVGWALIWNIRDLLHGKGPETWNGTLYTLIRSAQDPFHLDWDEKRRARFVVNFDIQRR